MNFNKAVMHKVPPYDELVRDTILDPKDKIALPNRMATQLRNTPPLTRFDDDASLNLNDEQERVARESIREVEVRTQATTTSTHYNTTTVNRARDEDTTT